LAGRVDFIFLFLLFVFYSLVLFLKIGMRRNYLWTVAPSAKRWTGLSENKSGHEEEDLWSGQAEG
jgi:hypothetical protein